MRGAAYSAVWLATLALSLPAAAQNTATDAAQDKKEPSQQLNRVEVTGQITEEEQRRASTASRIVVGKDEIEKYGDSSVSEVLKRLPGVTIGTNRPGPGGPGRGGDVRMRGMGGGYTQILLNGERMPPGFSLDNLAPEQLERIEIMRAPTAEFGARAVAGTLNLVLKEGFKITANDLRLGTNLENDLASGNVSWTRNDKIAGKLPYTFTVSALNLKSRDDTESHTLWTDLGTGNLLLDQSVTGSTLNQRTGVNLTARTMLPLGPGEFISIMPIVVVGKASTSATSRLTQTATSTVAAPYATSQSDNTVDVQIARANLQWQKKIDDATRLDLRLNGGINHNTSNGLRNEVDGNGALLRVTDDRSDARENSWNLNAKLSHQFVSEHSLVGGLELDNNTRSQARTTLQNGLPLLAEFGDDIQASTQRVAAYAQDEWNPNPQISAYAGLRWESIRTNSDSAINAVSNTSTVLTPLLHATWKPSEKSRNQWRSSLTRSYKAASLQELIARPSISQRYPTGANEINSPDRAGNPNLLPELASGFELAYEHYLSKGGLLSANFFYRRIQDLIRNTVALETVSWSDQARWVSRPTNVGSAIAQGIELEAKLRLDELWDGALPIAVRSNLSIFDSKVDQIPGPNNRLEGQPQGTLNLGADYKIRSLPISLGGTVNITPAYDLRINDRQSSYVGTKIGTDAFVLWSLNMQTQVRFSVNNLTPRDYLTSSTAWTDTQRQVTENQNPSHMNWGVRLELKL
jgi:outer membrane receptor for ferrienterochelin and colicins